jgi:uncharacterized membrane protein
MAHTLRPTPLAVFDSFPRALHELNRRLFGDPADEDALRPAAKLYLAAVTLAALGAALLTVGHATAPEPQRLALALALAGAMTLAGLFPLPFIAKTKLALDTAILVAAVLLFEPVVAMLIGASGMVLADLVRRQPWDQTLFNGAQTALLAAAGGGLLVAAQVRTAPDRPGPVLLVLGIGAGMWLVNTPNIATIVALQMRERVRTVWVRSLREVERAEQVAHVAQVAVGLLAAGVAAHSWPLALLVLAAGAGYQALARGAHTRTARRPVTIH